MAMTTQSRHPWRATLRTAVAVGVGLLPLLPEILGGLHLDSYAIGGQVLVIAAGITRLLANPAVETLLHQYAPWLAAQPAAGPISSSFFDPEPAPPSIAPPVPGRYPAAPAKE
jgi:hypothetical protein